MNYPNFFNTIETIKLKDNLLLFLGINENSLVEFSYLDVVKNAGHSCPTVAGAYLLCLIGLKKLYKNEIPKRGEIRVLFKENEKDGVAGVIANVVTHITGATSTYGFKGINGDYVRHSLMSFNEDITTSIKFKRVDTNEKVELTYNPSCIKPDDKIQYIMKKIKEKLATNEEKKLFGKLWQQRVENIFNNINQVITIKRY